MIHDGQFLAVLPPSTLPVSPWPDRLESCRASAAIDCMELEKLEYKVVMDDGPYTVVLARLADLELGAASFMAATLKYPKRNVQLRQGARIIKRHDGEPKPTPLAPDPCLPDWDVSLIRGAKLDFRGTVIARDEASAIKQAVTQFNLTADQARRLVVSRRR